MISIRTHEDETWTVLGRSGSTTAVVLMNSKPSGAMGLNDFVDRLGGAGYTVNLEPKSITHGGLNAQGTVITAEKFGVIARVEVLDYGSHQRLSEDWAAIDQKAPVPRRPTDDFAGKILVWNRDAVLVLDFDPPNDPGTVQVIAAVFLGRRGVSFEGLSPRIIPPGTGDGGLVLDTKGRPTD